MASVTPQLIRELRERTAAGMSDCKNALVEAKGDIDKAVELIFKKGKAKSASRAAATAAEGEIRAVISGDTHTGTLIEVNVQTDFASRSDPFRAFVSEVANLATGVEKVEDLLFSIMANGRSVAETRDELAVSVGEKIDIRRMVHVKLNAPHGRVHSYVHTNGKIGVLLAVEAENDAVASHEAFVKFVDDTAMQIAAMSPLYLDRTAVPAAEVDKQKEIFGEQLKLEGKPEVAWPKIIEGKVNKYFSDVCLVDQISVVDSANTVDEARAAAAHAAQGSIKLQQFVRYQLGEGIARVVDNMADEAMKMASI